MTDFNGIVLNGKAKASDLEKKKHKATIAHISLNWPFITTYVRMWQSSTHNINKSTIICVASSSLRLLSYLGY